MIILLPLYSFFHCCINSFLSRSFYLLLPSPYSGVSTKFHSFKAGTWQKTLFHCYMLTDPQRIKYKAGVTQNVMLSQKEYRRRMRSVSKWRRKGRERRTTILPSNADIKQLLCHIHRHPHFRRCLWTWLLVKPKHAAYISCFNWLTLHAVRYAS